MVWRFRWCWFGVCCFCCRLVVLWFFALVVWVCLNRCCLGVFSLLVFPVLEFLGFVLVLFGCFRGFGWCCELCGWVHNSLLFSRFCGIRIGVLVVLVCLLRVLDFVNFGGLTVLLVYVFVGVLGFGDFCYFGCLWFVLSLFVFFDFAVSVLCRFAASRFWFSGICYLLFVFMCGCLGIWQWLFVVCLLIVVFLVLLGLVDFGDLFCFWFLVFSCFGFRVCVLWFVFILAFCDLLDCGKRGFYRFGLVCYNLGFLCWVICVCYLLSGFVLRFGLVFWFLLVWWWFGCLGGCDCCFLGLLFVFVFGVNFVWLCYGFGVCLNLITVGSCDHCEFAFLWALYFFHFGRLLCWIVVISFVWFEFGVYFSMWVVSVVEVAFGCCFGCDCVLDCFVFVVSGLWFLFGLICLFVWLFGLWFSFFVVVGWIFVLLF